MTVRKLLLRYCHIEPMKAYLPMNRCWYLLPLLCSLLTCGSVPSGGEVPTAGFAPPALTNMDGAGIARVKAGVGAQDPAFRPAYTELLEQADSLLTAPLYAVTQKTTMPPSGSKNDYLSLAPYWWPDPEATDGLPWIRRDGEVNPLTRGLNVDVTARRYALDNFYRLSLAAYFSGKEAYADRAIQQLQTWFLAPDTRMNPHLNYAQGVPGRSDGRCYGIIEFRSIIEVITGVELLDHLGQLTDNDRREFDAWLRRYADWLMTSDLGREEASRLNNHGTWYDAQLVSILRHLGRKAEARKLLETAKIERVAAHLAADGSQPEEIARTKSLSYSTMNLEGLTILAYHAKRMGIDLWGYQDETGTGLPQAYAFLKPYALGLEVWPHEQLGSLEDARRTLRQQFLRAGSEMQQEDYCQIGSADTRSRNSLDNLLFPCPASETASKITAE